MLFWEQQLWFSRHCRECSLTKAGACSPQANPLVLERVLSSCKREKCWYLPRCVVPHQETLLNGISDDEMFRYPGFWWVPYPRTGSIQHCIWQLSWCWFCSLAHWTLLNYFPHQVQWNSLPPSANKQDGHDNHCICTFCLWNQQEDIGHHGHSRYIEILDIGFILWQVNLDWSPFVTRFTQYFTLLHEFQRIPLESHRMLEFHLDSAGMVGISNSCGFPWIPSGIPEKFPWIPSGIWMEFLNLKSHVT